MTPTSSTAAHLAELEARYEAHLSALRRHAAQLQAGVARDAADLAERAAPPAPPPAILDDAPLEPDSIP